MALTPAQKQRRYRERLKAIDQTNPDAIERELLQEVARCDRGEMPDQERIALADKLADLARTFSDAQSDSRAWRRSYEQAKTIHCNGSSNPPAYTRPELDLNRSSKPDDRATTPPRADEAAARYQNECKEHRHQDNEHAHTRQLPQPSPHPFYRAASSTHPRAHSRAPPPCRSEN